MMLDTEREINAYFDGKENGIWLFAWWKDGIQYVGTSGKTHKSALKEIKKERESALVTFKVYKEVSVD